MESLKEEPCLSAFLQGADEVASAKQGEKKKANKHARVTL